MTDNPEDAWLIALGAAVSDGAEIDWDQAELDAGSSDRRLIVQQMRRLADVVTAHRSGAGDAPDTADAATDETSVARQWRHIVLFEAIGAGAFGTVYRGWDPTLDREVAVKLLPKELRGGASPLEEARNLARIRHSNVVVVYGADRSGDEVGIWMEYIEGQTLAQMVRELGPMSASEVTGVGIDLCRALSALHASGLLHRDIKAHNVMRERGGRIVLMDFSGVQPIEGRVNGPVLSGTPLYMAPELFEGAPASFASEVYSLGVLLFFLLTGRLPVEGSSVGDVRLAHADGKRPRKRLRDLRPDVPDSTVQVIERATAENASDRYQTAGEFELALATASGSHPVLVESVREEISLSARKGRAVRWLAPMLFIGAIAGAAVAGAWLSDWGRPGLPEPTARFTVGPPYNSGSWPRISPDGRLIVFGAIVEGRQRFWLRRLDSLDGRALINTTATETPFWSPDSESLCFFDDGKLKRLRVNHGEPEVLAEAPHPHGGAWSGESIIFARGDGIYRIGLGKNPGLSRVTSVDESLGEYQHGWPEFLPDGRQFLYVIRSSRPERAGLYAGSLDGGAPQRVMPAFSRTVYVNGYLLFVRDGTLTAQSFDPRTRTLTGQPVALAGRVQYHGGDDAAFDVSSTGVLIYAQNPGSPSTRLMLFDARGREIKPITGVGAHRNPRFSPDGQRIVAEKISSDDHNIDLWLYDVARGTVARLTSDPAPDVRPTWSPDGRRVAFSSKRGSFHIYTKSVDTTEAEQPLVTFPGEKIIEHWSPDGRYLSATIRRSGLWIIPVDSSKEKPWRLRAGDRNETWQSEFSPDGRWLAYSSVQPENPEVYVEPFPPTGARWQISTHGGAEPHWRHGGKELLYLSTDDMLMSASLTPGGWQDSTPRPLFRLSVPDLTGSNDYAVSPDGQRIVVNTFIADPVIPPIEVIVNWTNLVPRPP